MRVALTRLAKAELAAAQDWYDDQQVGLGAQFLAEFQSLIRRLMDNPQQFPQIGSVVRRAGLRRVPYGLFFTVRGGAVHVFACFHASRDPSLWHRRLPLPK